MRGILILMGVSIWVWILSLQAFPQSEYKFDLSEIEKEIEKKPYSIGGFLEFEPILFGLDQDAALYRAQLWNNIISVSAWREATRKTGLVFTSEPTVS